MGHTRSRAEKMVSYLSVETIGLQERSSTIDELVAAP